MDTNFNKAAFDMRYPHHQSPSSYQREEVRVAVLADSLREESESQQRIQDIAAAAAAIAAAASIFMLMH